MIKVGNSGIGANTEVSNNCGFTPAAIGTTDVAAVGIIGGGSNNGLAYGITNGEANDIDGGEREGTAAEREVKADAAAGLATGL